MLRTLLTPRWLALLAVVVAVCVGFVWLGLWQMAVAQNSAIEKLQEERDALVEAPLDQVMTPHSAFPADGAGHPVHVEGQYDATRQFLVPNRLLDGVNGYWVVTPLVATDGAVIPVMRGFVTDPAQADLPPATPLTVRGELAPGESPALDDVEVAVGQQATIDLSVLTNLWPEDLYNGFIFSTVEEPQVSSTALAHVPPPRLTAGDVDWRNFGYALQWWVFAAFAVFMYVKLLHDASGERPDNRPTVSTTAPTDERIEPHHV